MLNFDLNEIPVVEELERVAEAPIVRPSNAPNGTAQGIPGLGPWQSSPEFAAGDSNMVQERRPQVTNGAPNWASRLGASVPAQCHRVVHQVIRPTPRRWDQLGACVENMPSIFRLLAPALGRPPAVPAAIDAASTYSDTPRQQGSLGADDLQQDVAFQTSTTKSVDETEHNGDSQGIETNGGSQGSETNDRTLELSAWKIDHRNNDFWEGKRPTTGAAVVSPALAGSTQMALEEGQDLPLVVMNKKVSSESESSAYLGMTSKDPETGRWEAHIWAKAANVYLQVGSFNTQEEASKFLSKHMGVKHVENHYRILLPARVDCDGRPIKKTVYGVEGVLQKESSKELITYVRRHGAIYPVSKKGGKWSSATKKSFPHSTIQSVIGASFAAPSATIAPSYRSLFRMMQRLPCIRGTWTQVKPRTNANRCCKNCRNAAKWMITAGPQLAAAQRALQLQTHSTGSAAVSRYIPPATSALLPAWPSRQAANTTIPYSRELCGVAGTVTLPVVMHASTNGSVNFSTVVDNERFHNLELHRAGAVAQDFAFMKELVSRGKESLMSIDSNLGLTLDSPDFFLTNPLSSLHSLRR